jgi:hypothetical protein
MIVSFLAAEAVALASETAEAGLPVGCVFLAVDPAAVVANDEGAAAEVVAQVLLHGRSGVVA